MNIIEWLRKLISFDTTSRNSNLELIAVVEEWFRNHNMQTLRTYDETKKKANLFATLPAKAGDVSGGIILSGHTDVVPIDGQDWQTDPFVATTVGDRIYGRGTSDMKGFLAVCLGMLPYFKQQTLSKPLHFAFSYDEEVGCLGAPHMIQDFYARGGKADGCIVGEPTEMHPVVAHKGIQVFRVRVKGLAAHSSLTSQACNAIDYAADIIHFLRQIADDLARVGPFDPLYDVTYSTVSTNMVRGGNAFNTIPAECEFIFEFRNLPQLDAHYVTQQLQHYIEQTLLPKMRKEHAQAEINVERLAHAPSFEADKNAEIYRSAFAITNAKTEAKVAYATEAGLFQAANIPTIVCGPGSITVAHRANEFVTLEQLQKCEMFLKKLIQ